MLAIDSSSREERESTSGEAAQWLIPAAPNPKPPHHDPAACPSCPRHPPPPSTARGRLARVRLDDFAPHDGAATPAYARTVHALAASLTRRNAALLQLPAADAAIVRCALESARAFFRAHDRDRDGLYVYRAGRTLDDGELSPACMADAFRCLGKAARTALCAIACHLRLRTDVFNRLLDDTPLPENEVSSSELLVAYSNKQLQNVQAPRMSQVLNG